MHYISYNRFSTTSDSLVQKNVMDHDTFFSFSKALGKQAFPVVSDINTQQAFSLFCSRNKFEKIPYMQCVSI